MEKASPVSKDSRTNLIYRLARATLAFVWIYQGAVPKLLFRDWSEMNMLGKLRVDIQVVPTVLLTLACLEIGFGLLILANWRSRWPLWATIGVMTGSLISVAQHSPRLLHAAFNPVSQNAVMIALAIIALTAYPVQADTSK